MKWAAMQEQYPEFEYYFKLVKPDPYKKKGKSFSKMNMGQFNKWKKGKGLR